MDIDKKWKFLGAGAITTAILWQKSKDLIFGNPRSKVRKALFTGFMTYMFVTQCQPNLANDIKQVFTSSADYVALRIDNKNKFDELKKQNNNLKEYTELFQVRFDSLRTGIVQNERAFYESKFDSLHSLIRRQNQNINYLKNENERITRTQSNNLSPRNKSFPTKESARKELVLPDYFNEWYVVKSGESFEDISKLLYGEEKFAPQLKEFNEIASKKPMMGFPLKLIPGRMNREYVLDVSVYPENTMVVRRGEHPCQVIKDRVPRGNSNVRAIRNYNLSLGNNINCYHSHWEDVILYYKK